MFMAFILIDIVMEMQKKYKLSSFSCKMAHSEKTRIWLLLKKSLPQLNKAGINPIEFLVWTQEKNISEVKNRILIIQSTIASEGSCIVKKDDTENNSNLFPITNKEEDEDDGFNLGEIDPDDIIDKVFLAR